MTILQRDKVLPTQPFFSDLWRGAGDYEAAVADFVTEYQPAPKLDLLTAREVATDEMSSPAAMLALLAALVSIGRAFRVLEIGSFIGRTSIFLAMLPGVQVTTLERSEHFAALAEQNARGNGVDDRVVVLSGETDQLLDRLARRSFDLIFIDGGKQHYAGYASRCEALLSSRGMMVIDDVFFHGDALSDQPATDKGRGCRAVVEQYRDRPGFRSALLPMANGVLLVWRT